MQLIALEEHFATPDVIAAWRALDPGRQDIAIRLSTGNDQERRLRDLADGRISEGPLRW